VTVTDAPVPAAATVSEDEVETRRRPGGLAATLGTADPIVLARLWIAASTLFLFAAGVSGAIIGVERLDTASIDVLDGALGDLASLHTSAGIFLFLVPMTLGIATAVVPLQLGSPTVAFPRGAATAFWIWLLSGGVMIASYFIDGGPVGSDPDGVALWYVGLGGVLVGILLATITVLTTLWAGRVAGMHLDRVPMFSWSMLVAGSVWLVSLPVLLAVLLLQYLGVRYGSFEQVPLAAWATSAPQVFAYALPALGFLLDAVAVASGRRLARRGVLLAAIGAAGVLSFGADLVASADDPSIFEDVLYVGGAFVLLLPLLAVGGGIGATLRRGRPALTSGLLFGVSAYLMILTGAAVNAVRVVDGLDLTGTTADSSVAHYALLGGLIGVAGAVHHWSSKIFGVVLGEGPARLGAVALLIGTVTLALPDLISGFLDQPANLLPGQPEDGVEALNLVSLIGGAIVIAGVLIVVVNVLAGAAQSDDTPVAPDPWGTGQTLEWLALSPPDVAGVGPLEPVVSAEPLLDLKEREGVEPEEGA
jgi:cytochrome c oxidase subunit 1